MVASISLRSCISFVTCQILSEKSKRWYLTGQITNRAWHRGGSATCSIGYKHTHPSAAQLKGEAPCSSGTGI